MNTFFPLHSFKQGVCIHWLATSSTIKAVLFCILLHPLSTTLSYGQADTTNLALTATVTTSHVSSWETLSAVKDGFTPANSGDKENGAYGNWSGDENYNTYNWVQYEWTLAKTLTSTSVYWWADGQGIRQPTDAYLEFWNGSSWVRGPGIDSNLNNWNSVKLAVQTSRVRIYMKSDAATGIIEWRVFGIESGPCTPSAIVAKVRSKDGPMLNMNTVNIIAGDSVSFIPEASSGGTWSWSGPLGFLSSDKDVTLRNATPEQSGTYTTSITNTCGATTIHYFHLTVSRGHDYSSRFSWTPYDPSISYNFRDEFQDISEPTQDLNDCTGVVGSQSSGWWTFKWGASANALVTSASITPLLARMNEEFAYIRDVMGWPPDKRAKNGYRSAIYLYGSGLCTDNASNTALGGWQSSINYQGQNWPMVLISYYPVYSFSPVCTYTDRIYQMDAVVHEGIHTILADMPGIKRAAWFHEGGNTWLQQETTARKTGNYSSMGFLNGVSFMAPFIPIECYRGWLQDGSFGGPSAEGVNMFEGETQVSTWRNLLGGVQYSNTFPTFLGLTLGSGSLPWIWRHCPERVLEGMATHMGETQIRKLITEYRAKQALIDMGPWTNAIMKLMNTQFGTAIKAEGDNTWLNPATWYASPYAKTTRSADGVLTPEYRTTPGWSGANQIPLVVDGPVVTVNFKPLGPNMTIQLCYRTRDGQAIYGTPVYGGDCSLSIDQPPANNVIFAVITNTDYKYLGEETRKAHFDYRLKLVEGVKGTADVDKKWFDWTKEITPTNVRDINTSGPGLNIYPNPVVVGGSVRIESPGLNGQMVDISITTVSGTTLWRGDIAIDSQFTLPASVSGGLFFVTLATREGRTVKKLVVN